MSDQTQGRTPDGGDESAAVRVGEAVRESDSDERRAREEERPYLDERERRIRTQRKPMGPPLEDADELAERRGPEESPEPPTEPPMEPGEQP
jgi:hypothetical protein